MPQQKSIRWPAMSKISLTNKIAIAVSSALLICGSVYGDVRVDANTTANASGEPALLEARAANPSKDYFYRRFYAGVGIGLADISSDTDDDLIFGVNESKVISGQFALGVDILPRLSIEVQTVFPESIGLAPSGNVNHKHFNASALFYVGRGKVVQSKAGLSAFARIGFGNSQAQTSKSVGPVTDSSRSDLILGLGLELGTRNGWGVRAEWMRLQDDFNLAQIGVVYRFGTQNPSALSREKLKSNQDYVGSNSDANSLRYISGSNQSALGVDDFCAIMPLNNFVGKSKGQRLSQCDQMIGEVGQIFFPYNQSQLDNTATQKLDMAALVLRECEIDVVTLQGHTDSFGTEDYNFALSKRRASTVAKYLAKKGIARNQFNPIYFGELQPLLSNDTFEGRESNRRVTLVVE